MKIETFQLPAHWAAALINADPSGLDEDDNAALDAFTDWMMREYNQCWPIDCDDEPQFMRYHDAAKYGVLACHTLTYSFDITPQL